MNNVFSAKSETFAERCATKKILRSCVENEYYNEADKL